MNKENLNPFCFLLALVVLIFAVASTLNGQEPTTKDENVVTIDAPGPLRGGEGFSAGVPSWFSLLKVEAGHYTDFGSGCFISDRLVLSCSHNLRDAEGARLSIVGGLGTRYNDVSVVLQSPKLDLALLRVNDKVVPYHRYLTVSDDDFAPDGVVTSVGFNPSQNSICAYAGRLTGQSYGSSGLKGPVSHKHTAKVVQGMSGGPLLNDRGRVVGVNVNAFQDGSGSLAVNLTRLQWFLDQYDAE
jgi:S1-C subfamily serine protease